jgi:hypothetical protein
MTGCGRHDRSLEADVMRTSECGYAASKRAPSRSPLTALAEDDTWATTVESFRARHPRRRDQASAYDELVAGGAHHAVAAAVLDGSYRPNPPTERWLNKLDGRKKRVFQYPALDELLFRTVHRLVQPAAAGSASPWCRSFLPGGGARLAFRSVLADRAIDAKAVLRLDVRDYFNTIDVDDLLARLATRPPFDDARLASLVTAALRDRRVVRGSEIVDGAPKGVMAGTPLAPVLATLYLADLDEEIAAAGATYARYSDDVLVAAPPDELPAIDALLRARLAERGLEVNEAKTATSPPGAPWDFLGFRWHAGAIGLAPVTERKLRARTTRLARGLLRWRERTGADAGRTLRAFVRRVNQRLYTGRAERSEFSWASWFLPLLTVPDQLAPLDEHIRREARYATTGRRTARTRRAVPYSSLVDAGYVPLVTAYWAFGEGPGVYDDLVARRIVRPQA